MGLVVGDGDNIAMVKTDRFHWFQQRLAACAQSGRDDDEDVTAHPETIADDAPPPAAAGAAAPPRARAETAAEASASAAGDARAAVPCFPLMWSLSPHLLTLAPAMARWFYAGAAATGADYFVLPPSGHLYAYPSQASAEPRCGDFNLARRVSAHAPSPADVRKRRRGVRRGH